MDSLDLLAREDEFKKLNKQLEKKTESLMREIEHVMQKQDFFAEFSSKLTISPHDTPTRKHSCGTPKTQTQPNTPTKPKSVTKKKILTKECEKQEERTVEIGTEHSNQNSTNRCRSARVICDCSGSSVDRMSGDLEFLYAFVSVSVEEKVLPPSFLKEKATVENVCKFLSSKIKLMQEQIDKLQSTLHKKASQCEVHLTHQAELESERMTLLNRANNLRASSADLRAKNMAVQKKLEEKERLYKEQRSEADKLSSEVKRLRSKAANVESRSASQEEIIENLKHQLETAKRTEKEFRDSTRSLSSSHQTAVSKLESQLKSLTTTVQRQNALIDNLKRQNVLLSTEGALRALEKDYCNFLTQDL